MPSLDRETGVVDGKADARALGFRHRGMLLCGSMRRSVQRVLVAIAIGSFGGIPAANVKVRGRSVTNAGIRKDGSIHILRSNGTEFVARREMSPVQLSDMLGNQAE